jgi:hypothetical protein
MNAAIPPWLIVPKVKLTPEPVSAFEAVLLGNHSVETVSITVLCATVFVLIQYSTSKPFVVVATVVASACKLFEELGKAVMVL